MRRGEVARSQGRRSVVPPEMGHLEAGGAGAVLQLLPRPQTGGERGLLDLSSLDEVLVAGGAEAGRGIAMPGLPDLQAATAGICLHQTLGLARRVPLVGGKPGRVEEEAPAGQEMAGGGRDARARSSSSIRWTKGSSTATTRPKRGRNSACRMSAATNQTFVESGEPPAGDRDHLRRELERHHAARGAGESGRGASGARPQLEHAAARRRAGRPGPQLLVAAPLQLEIVEREDLVVVVPDLAGESCAISSSSAMRTL